MQRYFKTLVARVLGIERGVMCLDKNGYLNMISLFVKILPKVDKGLEIIGFVNKVPDTIPETYCLMVDMSDGMILGVSRNCFTNFGIPSRFVYGFA